MNADGDFAKQLKDITVTSVKDTASKDSIKTIVVSSLVAAAAAGVVEASGGVASLEKGKDYAVWKPDPKLVKARPDLYSNYNGVVDSSVNNIGKANVTMDVAKVGQPVPPYSTNPFTSSFWQGFGKESGFISSNTNKVGGMNGMSTFHDPITDNIFFEKVPLTTQLSIPPAIAIEYCAISPAACGAVVSSSRNNRFGNEK